jgi:hypothetical protein
VTPTEHTTKTPSSATTGIVAKLRGLFGVKGTGAPSPTPATGSGASSSGLLAVVVALLALLSGLAAAAPANAESPWWHMTSGSRPTNLRSEPGLAPGHDEVQKLTVSATSGDFFLSLHPGELALEQVVPFDATAQQVREVVERFYGAGNVEVTEGPGDETGSKPYVIRFVGELADQRVPVLSVESTPPFLEGEFEKPEGSGKKVFIAPLKGGTLAKSSEVSEVTQGAVAKRQIVVTAANVGDAGTNGVVTITDKLPAGLKAAGIEAIAGVSSGIGSQGPVKCSSTTLTCTFGGTFERVNGKGETEVVPEVLPPYDQIEVLIGVEVQPGASSGEVNEASISGAGAPADSIRRHMNVSEAPTPFGVEDNELTPEEEGGGVDTQAGSHPFQLTTTLVLNQTGAAQPAAFVKDLSFKWPPGLIGNPIPFPRCTMGQFLTKVNGVEGALCPALSVVGVSIVSYNEPNIVGVVAETAPVFDLEPSVGEPARFGFATPVGPVFIDPSVRTGGDYGITVHVDNITQTAGFFASQTTVWGVPGDPRHDKQRGNLCINEAREPGTGCKPLEETNPPSFLSLPTSCTGPLQTSVEADSWVEPANVVSTSPDPSEPMPALDGCNRLPFTPSIILTPDGQAASTPTGLTTDVHVPQAESLNANGLAEGDVKDITVALPEGLQLNPAAADGLGSCSQAQIGFTGENPETHMDEFTPGEPSCPDSAKVANVKITSPVLANPLKGAVYLASPQNFAGIPQENPFSALVAMYIVAKDPVSGVIVKLPGSVSLDQATGQITATFKNSPQVPFEDAELEFYGGNRAPLATPAHCGTYTANASFASWSGNEPVGSSSHFEITSGPNAGPCPPAALPFSPSLAAGSPNINAGSFSPLNTTISREDGNQSINQVTLHMAPGMSGILAGVPLCPDAQANAGTCSAASQIGETIVSVGLGGDPFTVTGGKVYLTEKYAGGAFGLSIVNPADAGPFHLGKVVVRASIQIDPLTAALTITTGEIPHIIKGFPLQIKHVNVSVNREHFTFNPTNCNPMSITGTIGAVEGATSPVSDPFQVTNCALLKFTPKFSVSTSGKTSKANGASLTTKVAEPPGALGTQSNITRVKVDLPIQLPSRLTTLQKACLDKVFAVNPAGCPSASIIGHAKVITPLLPVPLEGPAYFVSHGGEAFPSLEIVLQGYGVTVDLVGTTFISKAGITSTTFKTVPDTPFNTFELTLPQGKFSALGANLPAKAKGSFCGQSLKMPTEFVAQNGLVIHQQTPIAVTGCAKPKTRAQLYAAALKACHTKHNHAKRRKCEKSARKTYAPLKRKK